MASGYSFTGGPSRCFAYWQEFTKCYSNTDNPQQCKLQAEDYLECLHHTKEIERAKTVKAHFIKKVEHEAKEGRKAGDILADGVIVGLGLINRKDG
ncbi:hypothetical protein ACEPAF_1434 [Sanghuangporus sanghuang]